MADRRVAPRERMILGNQSILSREAQMDRQALGEVSDLGYFMKLGGLC